MAQHKISLQVFKVADDDGSHAASVSQDQIVSRVTRANEIYKGAGVEFVFQPSTDLVTLRSTLLNRDFILFDDPAAYTKKAEEPPHDREAHERARAQLADLYPGKLVVLFCYRTKLEFDGDAGPWTVKRRGGSTSWYASYVHMPGTGGNVNMLTHELGHYLQIRHTFGAVPGSVLKAAAIIKDYVEKDGHPKSEGLDALDGDRVWVRDTPADAGSDIFVAEGLSKCGAVGQITIPVKFSDGSAQDYALAPNRTNIMSYFGSCPGTKTISLEQGQRVRDGLEIGLRRRLVSSAASGLSGQVTRRGSGEDGAISTVDVAAVRAGRVATAVRDGDGNLRVTAWDLSPAGNSVTRRGTGTAGAVGDAKICSLGLGMVATAVRDSQGNLKVIVWRISPAGDIERLGSASAGKASRISACRLGIEHLATSVRDANGNLEVIAWQVTASGGIKVVATASAGAVSELAVSGVGHDSIVTHLRDGAGNLRLIVWRLEGNKKLVRCGAAGAAGVSQLAGVSADWLLPVSAARDSSNNLEVIAWEVADDDRDIVRRGRAGAGAIGRVACCGMGVDLLATAVQDGGGDLKVILWRVSSGGYYVGRLGDAGAGGVGEIAMCPASADLFVTAVETREHKLKLIAWQMS